MLELLREDFVVGWKNIRREDYVGYSRGYSRRQSAVDTTNGAGGHNVQMFVMTPDLVVLHALPGFWHPDDLLRELRFALVVGRLWGDDTKTREEKDRMFRLLHIAELRRQPAETYARSAWQGFDRRVEERKLRDGEEPDTFLYDSYGELILDELGKPVLKPLNVVTRQRMVEQPFRSYDEFDVAAFVDHGLFHYDNNRRVDKRGRDFGGQVALQRKRAREARRGTRGD